MATESLTSVGTLYSAPVGFIFVFNLICGTGILTMPRAFQETGWLLSLISVAVLAVVGYLTATYLIESMGVANALLKIEGKHTRQKKRQKKNESEEKTSLLEAEQENASYSGGTAGSAMTLSKDKHSGVFDSSGDVLSNITLRVELGQMASMFYPRKFMVVGFYLAMCIYLYGDLAIYSVAIPKSLQGVACTYTPNISNVSGVDMPIRQDEMCWPGVPSISRLNAYRLFLTIFVLMFGPFVFFNVQKTKYLQFFTIFNRLSAFGMMLILVIIRLSKGYDTVRPQVVNFTGLPTLFGICVYSFMTHHSLPSLITPIRNKNSLLALLGGDYVAIFGVSVLLSMTAVFSFHHLVDLYSLNFFHDHGPHPITNVAFVEYYLALFPVLTLCTTYPIIGVTLRNNLITLGHLFRDSYPCERIFFPLITLIPPFAVAIISTNVEVLVSFTGSYAGAVIQYLIPAAMVYYARKQFTDTFGEDSRNRHRSMFRHWVWLVLVGIWFIICIAFVTVNHIMSGISHFHHHSGSNNHHQAVNLTDIQTNAMVNLTV